jgi:hypothetical protein
MTFAPAFTITTRMNSAITGIERARGFLKESCRRLPRFGHPESRGLWGDRDYGGSRVLNSRMYVIKNYGGVVTLRSPSSSGLFDFSTQQMYNCEITTTPYFSESFFY